MNFVTLFYLQLQQKPKQGLKLLIPQFTYLTSAGLYKLSTQSACCCWSSKTKSNICPSVLSEEFIKISDQAGNDPVDGFVWTTIPSALKDSESESPGETS